MRLTALAFALVACDAALGIEVLPRSDGRAPIVYAAPECEKCTKCAEQRVACAGDSQCDKVQRCFAACKPNDVVCRMECDTQFPLAATTYGAVDRCLRQSCTEQCLGVSWLGAIFGDDCACLETACGKEALDCIRDGNCERRLACIKRSGLDPDHTQVCVRTITDGESIYTTLRNCYSTIDCPRCPLGRDGTYECTKNFRWALSSAVKVAVELKVTTFDARRDPVPGVTVKACTGGQCASCGEGIDRSVTDALGIARLNVPSRPVGFTGCFTLEGDNFVPMIVHTGFPVIRDVRLEMFAINKSSLGPLGLFFGTKALSDRGHLVTIGADCLDWAARGLQVAVEPTDGETRSAYYVNTTLDPKATETGAFGTAFFLNLPPRATPPTKVDVTRKGELVSRSFVVIAPEHITVALMFPLTAE